MRKSLTKRARRGLTLSACPECSAEHVPFYECTDEPPPRWWVRLVAWVLSLIRREPGG